MLVKPYQDYQEGRDNSSKSPWHISEKSPWMDSFLARKRYQPVGKPVLFCLKNSLSLLLALFLWAALPRVFLAEKPALVSCWGKKNTVAHLVSFFLPLRTRLISPSLVSLSPFPKWRGFSLSAMGQNTGSFQSSDAQTQMRFLPIRRRRAMTALPPWVLFLTRNPWVLFLFVLDGWYVLFMASFGPKNGRWRT